MKLGQLMVVSWALLLLMVVVLQQLGLVIMRFLLFDVGFGGIFLF